MKSVVETEVLEKAYDTGDGEPVQALSGITLSVAAGEIYALLGPNGAGKTTLLSILTTLLLPTGGIARVAGFDVVRQPAEVRRRIGVTFQEVVVDDELTGRQTLDFHGQLYGLDRSTRAARIDELVALVELADVLDRKSGTYSGGMKRRLELARGLITAPEVLFLDEPTQGLDPQNRTNIWEYVRDLRAQRGIALILTTHYMEEAEALADRVGIVDHGKLVVEGSPTELVRAMGADVITLTGSGDGNDLQQRLTGFDFVSGIAHHTDGEMQRFQIGVDNGEHRLAAAVGAAIDSGFGITQITTHRPSLADVFLAYTGHDLRDE